MKSKFINELNQLDFELMDDGGYRKTYEEGSIEVFGNIIRVCVYARFNEPHVTYSVVKCLGDILDALDLFE